MSTAAHPSRASGWRFSKGYLPTGTKGTWSQTRQPMFPNPNQNIGKGQEAIAEAPLTFWEPFNTQPRHAWQETSRISKVLVVEWIGWIHIGAGFRLGHLHDYMSIAESRLYCSNSFWPRNGHDKMIIQSALDINQTMETCHTTAGTSKTQKMVSLTNFRAFAMTLIASALALTHSFPFLMRWCSPRHSFRVNLQCITCWLVDIAGSYTCYMFTQTVKAI